MDDCKKCLWVPLIFLNRRIHREESGEKLSLDMICSKFSQKWLHKHSNKQLFCDSIILFTYFIMYLN